MKLQMHALEVGNQLEETSTQALAAIPRVLREVERLRKDVRGSVVDACAASLLSLLRLIPSPRCSH